MGLKRFCSSDVVSSNVVQVSAHTRPTHHDAPFPPPSPNVSKSKNGAFLVNFIVVDDTSPAPSMAPTSEGKMGACCFIQPTKLRPGVFCII
jgi:hypothetical protein